MKKIFLLLFTFLEIFHCSLFSKVEKKDLLGSQISIKEKINFIKDSVSNNEYQRLFNQSLVLAGTIENALKNPLNENVYDLSLIKNYSLKKLQQSILVNIYLIFENQEYQHADSVYTIVSGDGLNKQHISNVVYALQRYIRHQKDHDRSVQKKFIFKKAFTEKSSRNPYDKLKFVLYKQIDKLIDFFDKKSMLSFDEYVDYIINFDQKEIDDRLLGKGLDKGKAVKLVGLDDSDDDDVDVSEVSDCIEEKNIESDSSDSEKKDQIHKVEDSRSSGKKYVVSKNESKEARGDVGDKYENNDDQPDVNPIIRTPLPKENLEENPLRYDAQSSDKEDSADYKSEAGSQIDQEDIQSQVSEEDDELYVPTAPVARSGGGGGGGKGKRSGRSSKKGKRNPKGKKSKSRKKSSKKGRSKTRGKKSKGKSKRRKR